MIDRRDDSSVKSGIDNRAVSEVVAFILVFAIILTSVGLLYSTGFQAMTGYQENEQLRNAERAMDALADNLNDVLRYSGIEQRQGEISLREGTVRTGDSGTKINITINNGTDDRLGTDDRFAGYDDEYTVDLGEFTYTTEGNRIAYEGGGLVRGDESEDWSTVLKRPQLRCNEDTNTAIISLVAVSAEDRSIQSSGGLGFTMSVENRSSKVYDGVHNVTIEADEETAYDAAWNDTLDSGDWDGSGLEGTCDFDSDDGRVVVTIVEVAVTF